MSDAFVACLILPLLPLESTISLEMYWLGLAEGSR